MVGRKGAQHTFPVITHQKVPISNEKQGALSLSGTTVSLNTQASISPSVLSHFPYSVLIQHRHFEWVIITVSVSKWHVNTLGSSLMNTTNSLLQREEILLLNIKSPLEIRI